MTTNPSRSWAVCLATALSFGTGCGATPVTAVPLPAVVAEPTVTAVPAPFDESQPEYWVEKLSDDASRSRAVQQLTVFYEDELSKAGQKHSAPEVRALVDKLVDPLSETFVERYSTLDETARESLVRLLAEFNDPRAQPAFAKAFEEFARTGRGGKEIKWASRAVRDMKITAVAPALFRAFKQIKPSTKEGAYYRDVNEALLAVPQPAWAPELVAMLELGFPLVDRSKPETLSALRDRIYQTVTAAILLGQLRAGTATRPLLKVILDPARRDAANEALLSLVMIGRPATEAAVKLLLGEDPELVAYHQAQLKNVAAAPNGAAPNGSAHVPLAAHVAAAVGRREAEAPILAALSRAKEVCERVQLLGALSMLPHTPNVKAAFQAGFRALPPKAQCRRENASGSLSDEATLFFDAAMTDTLVRRGRELRDDKIALSLVALAATKTMDTSHVPAVRRLIDALHAHKEEEGPVRTHLEGAVLQFRLAQELLETCKEDAACYVAEAQKPENQDGQHQIAGMKALYRVGQLSGPESADALLAAMPRFEEASLRYVAAQVLDHHFPNGSTPISDQLQAIVDENAKSMDMDKVSGDKSLRDVMYRLRARAQ